MTEALTTSRAIKIPDSIIGVEEDADIIIGIDLTATIEGGVDHMITIGIVAIKGLTEADMVTEAVTGITEIEDMTEVDLETEADHTADLRTGQMTLQEELGTEKKVRKKLTNILKQLKEQNSQSDTRVPYQKEKIGTIILIPIMLR